MNTFLHAFLFCTLLVTNMYAMETVVNGDVPNPPPEPTADKFLSAWIHLYRPSKEKIPGFNSTDST